MITPLSVAQAWAPYYILLITDTQLSQWGVVTITELCDYTHTLSLKVTPKKSVRRVYLELCILVLVDPDAFF